MTSYKVIMTPPLPTALLVVGDDIVFQSAPILGWTVGRPFTYVRDYCRSHGWVIEPLSDNHRPVWIELDGRAYEIIWHENSIEGIILHESGEDPRDLRYDELPDILKEQL